MKGSISLGQVKRSVGRSIFLPDLVLDGSFRLDDRLQMSSATRLGDGISSQVINLLLSGVAGVRASGDVGCQSTEKSAVHGAGACGLNGQALRRLLLLLLLREGDNGGHCDKFEVVWSLLVVGP